MALNHHDELLIQSLSSTNVEETFFGLRRFIKGNGWVGKNNRYSTGTVAKIVSELRGGSIQKAGHLSQYIAASSLLHCADGWSYLGKSILALLRGDPHRSRHFGYYAELRAAMSLLASQGVGVFDKKHVIINGKNSVAPFTGSYGTHQFAWDSLKCWSASPASGNVFARTIRPGGLSLDEWMTPLGGAIAVAPQAESWFQQWGMDLKVGLDDRNLRNESSYRPDGLPKAWYLDGRDAVGFIHGLWLTLEPSEESRFNSIDRHILRMALEQNFKGRHGKASTIFSQEFEQFVASVLAPLNFSSDVEKWWIEFLTRKIYKIDPQIFSSSGESLNKQGTSYASIISRATLLLRVASGAALGLLQSASVTADATMFWWKNLGIARGLWDGDKSADQLTDLWADIDLILKDLESFQQKHGAANQSFLRVGSELGSSLVGLGSCERVAIWGMTPSI
jgi:hypothetical protein